jgi:hypothetical protein
VGLYSTGAFAVDEVRIGTTYADVVPASAKFQSCQDDDHDGDDDHGHGHGH